MVLAFPRPGQADASGHRPGALEALAVVMGNGGTLLGFLQYYIQAGQGKPHRADPHSRAVTEAVVRGKAVAVQPPYKHATIAGVRVAPAIFLESDSIVFAVQDAVGHGHGQHRVFGEAGIEGERLKVIRFGIMPFV